MGISGVAGLRSAVPRKETGRVDSRTTGAWARPRGQLSLAGALAGAISAPLSTRAQDLRGAIRRARQAATAQAQVFRAAFISELPQPHRRRHLVVFGSQRATILSSAWEAGSWVPSLTMVSRWLQAEGRRLQRARAAPEDALACEEDALNTFTAWLVANGGACD